MYTTYFNSAVGCDDVDEYSSNIWVERKNTKFNSSLCSRSIGAWRKKLKGLEAQVIY